MNLWLQGRPGARSVGGLKAGLGLILFFAALGIVATGCGPSDDAQTDCRCTEDTDLNLFGFCAGVDLNAGRPDASNPFSTRLPDCPSSPRIPLLEPTRAEFVLANIEIAVENFSPIQYVDQLTEDFLFVPDEADLDLFPDVFPAPPGYDTEADTDSLWTLEEERRFATSAFIKQAFVEIKFNRWYTASFDADNASGLAECAGISGTRECFAFPYDVDFIPEEGETISVKGRIEVVVITLNEENPSWTLRRWQDFRDEASAKISFTQFRAQFSQ
jgi:hypothetical protein